jgi:two-component system CitB family response regulator
MSDWRVLVVEPDSTVARSTCRCVAGQSGFAVVGVARTAEQALTMVGPLRPHLLIVELELAGEHGLTLLRRLRASGSPVEVVVVSSVTDARVVRAAVQLGAVDYVAKPFRCGRLRQALGLFMRRAATAKACAPLAQEEIDELTVGGFALLRSMPRDLHPGRLDEVRHALRDAGATITADEVGETIGVARTTARRYLEYLVTLEEATVDAVPNGPGRPTKAYRAVPEMGLALAS